MAKFKMGQEVHISPNASIREMLDYAAPVRLIGIKGKIIQSRWAEPYGQRTYFVRFGGLVTHEESWWFLESMLTNYKNLNDLVLNP